MKIILIAALCLTGTAACGSTGPAQSAECKKYVTCYDKATGTTGTLDSTYGASGTCWITQGNADACYSACTAALPPLKISYPDVTECQ